MKNRLTLLLVPALLAGCSTETATTTTTTTQANAPISLVGYVSDSMCGLEHAAMIKAGGVGDNDVSCVETCVKNGYKYVIADRDAKKLYNVSDESVLKPHAGKKVQVSGSLVGTDPAKPVLNVQSISPMTE